MGWNGEWIGGDVREGVVLFRRAIELTERPDSLELRVSADRHFKLLVDGRVIALGPGARDLERWPYVTIDLAPALAVGRNVVAALVWNAGDDGPWHEVGHRAAFLLDGDPRLDTNDDWEVAAIPEWHLRAAYGALGPEVFFVGHSPETYDARTEADWTELPMNDALDWRPANVLMSAREHRTIFAEKWPLAPRAIPPMRYAARGKSFSGTLPLTIDEAEIVNAYPRVHLVGPKGAVVALAYAEAAVPKGHRDVTEERALVGPVDRIVLGDGPTFWEPLDWRSYRFLRLVSDTEGVELRGYEAVETGYPLKPTHRIEIPDEPDLAKLEELSVRTLSRCMADTYMDCPHYERLQYVGDTRIQAMIGYYLSPDRALQRQAIDLFDRSRRDGLPMSRYPSRSPQWIPPFGLWWVLMRQDQRLYDRVVPPADPDDPAPIDAAGLDAVNAVNRADGQDWWFADWCPQWENGVPRAGSRATLHRLALYLAHAATERLLDWPTPEAAARGRTLWEYMRARLSFENGWVRHADDPDWEPTEHAEALLRSLQRRLGVAEDPWPADRSDAVRATIYFRYYLHDVLPFDPALFDPWREMIQDGLSTFHEGPIPPRSDCHAWSAHPLLTFFTRMAGITSCAPGWRAARIAPDPGPYRRFRAEVPHPDGPLSVEYEDGALQIDSPVPYLLEWQGRSERMQPGKRSF